MPKRLMMLVSLVSGMEYSDSDRSPVQLGCPLSTTVASRKQLESGIVS